jgi:hypothetical protein
MSCTLWGDRVVQCSVWGGRHRRPGCAICAAGVAASEHGEGQAPQRGRTPPTLKGETLLSMALDSSRSGSRQRETSSPFGTPLKKSIMRHHLLLPLFASFALAACGQPMDGLEGDDGSFGSLSQPIVNGTLSEEADNAAVFIHVLPDHICSATLIAPNLIATALHCITDSSANSFTCNSDGTLSEDSQNAGAGRMGELLDPEGLSVRVGPDSVNAEPAAWGIESIGTGSGQICRNDIAFVVLDRNVDAPVAKVRLDYGVRTGDRVRVMGYGAREDGRNGQRYVREGVRVVDVGPASDNATSVSAAPKTFVVTEGPCQGDSGGPAISEETGALVGVYSLSAGSTCVATGVRNVYTALASFAGLAREAFAAAGAEPILDEPPTAPVAPPAVRENACSLASSPRSGGAGSLGFVMLGALGLGLVARRRRV